MKSIVYKCDCCDYKEEREYIAIETGNKLINGLIGISETDNRNSPYEPIRNFKELCLECRKKAIEELSEFLRNCKYFY